MQEHGSIPYFREIILFLTLAGILIPLLQRLRVNQVLGFLAVGALVGPYGLGALADELPWLEYLSFPRVQGVDALAEVGVLFLMFLIGLDLSAERLIAMRRWVFGAGAAQVAFSALAIGLVAHAFDNTLRASLILGLVLSFSSTAVVMQLLTQAKTLGTPTGRASFSVLLFQDLAVVPLLIFIGILGQSGQADFAGLLGVALAKAVVAIVAIYVLGRKLIRPVFHHLGATRQADSFMALTLLSTLGIAAITAFAGLSMALGAFLAGLLLAETEYRHEVEVAVEPFKGLLMGLFFMSVGMGVDFHALLSEPFWLPLSVFGLVAIKALIVVAIFRLFGLSLGRAVEGGLLLGPGGEFAFIVIGASVAGRLIDRDIGQFMLLTVGFSMFLAPMAARAGQAARELLDGRGAAQSSEAGQVDSAGLEGHVVLAGYGRVGQLLGDILAARGISFIALDNDAKLVRRFHSAGARVYSGDASRPELLRHLGVDRAAAVVLTMDHTAAALRAVAAIRREYPHVPLVTRARDEKHALALREAGASLVIPETLEAGLQMASFVLVALGLPEDATGAAIEKERERRIVAFRND